jgi:hypothetical protein
MLPRRVMLPSHRAKMRLLHPLHLLITLISQVKIKALNPHHRRQPSSSDRPTPTLNCYKKSIGALPTVIFSFYRRSMLIVHPHNDIHNYKLIDPILFSK